MADRPNRMNTIFAFVAVALLAGAGVWIGFGKTLTGQGATTTTGPGATPPAPAPKTWDLTINNKKFTLDLSIEDETRFKGLSGRTEIPESGGMLFAFNKVYTKLDFVMRDCPINIDVIFLDASGRVVAWHKMVHDPPRTKEEEAKTAPAGYPAWAATNEKYENRLKKYSSKFSAQFAVELKGGMTDSLDLKAGQKLDLDVAALKKIAK